jgi:hypothetical protein
VYAVPPRPVVVYFCLDNCLSVRDNSDKAIVNFLKDCFCYYRLYGAVQVEWVNCSKWLTDISHIYAQIIALAEVFYENCLTLLLCRLESNRLYLSLDQDIFISSALVP